MTSTVPFLYTESAELVVPKSIPKTIFTYIFLIGVSRRTTGSTILVPD
jgi:uncharacterized membrane protein